MLGIVSGPFGEVEEEVRAPAAGIVIGRTHLPVVNEGDALFHVAIPRRAAHAEAADAGDGRTSTPPPFDEDEII